MRASGVKRLQLDFAGWLRPGPNSLVRQRRHQSLGVEHRVAAEHEIDGPGQLDGQDGVGLEFIAVHPGFQPLGQRADDRVVALGNHRRLAEGPAQIRVAEFGPAQALELAGAGDRAFDQPAVGHEILDGGKAVDVADFVENGHAQVFADARDGLEQGVVAGSGLFGQSVELCFQGGDLGVVMADEGQIVLEGELADGVVLLRQQLSFPRLAVGTGLAQGRTVVGQLMRLDAAKQFAAAPHIEEALAQERAQRAFLGGIDVGRGDEVGAQQVGEFFGINAVVLVLAAVDGFEVEGVSQDKVQAGGLTGIRQPIPPEHAFGADGQVVAIRRDELEEVSEVIVPDVGVDELFTVPVHEADVHLAGMEVDSAVEFCGRGVILHNVILHGYGVLNGRRLIVIRRGVRLHSPPRLPMLSKNQKGLTGSIKSLQATRDGALSSASRAYSPVGPRTFTGFTLVGPACLSSGR